jgi:hypothetical protein
MRLRIGAKLRPLVRAMADDPITAGIPPKSPIMQDGATTGTALARPAARMLAITISQ